jgi:hypothetical protein
MFLKNKDMKVKRGTILLLKSTNRVILFNVSTLTHGFYKTYYIPPECILSLLSFVSNFIITNKSLQVIFNMFVIIAATNLNGEYCY